MEKSLGIKKEYIIQPEIAKKASAISAVSAKKMIIAYLQRFAFTETLEAITSPGTDMSFEINGEQNEN